MSSNHKIRAHFFIENIFILSLYSISRPRLKKRYENGRFSPHNLPHDLIRGNQKYIKIHDFMLFIHKIVYNGWG